VARERSYNPRRTTTGKELQPERSGSKKGAMREK